MINDLMRDAKENAERPRRAQLRPDRNPHRTRYPALVESLPVLAYGAEMSLIQLATISVPESRQLMIRPFDSSTLKAIEKLFRLPDWDSPNNDGKVIRLNLPH